MRAAWVIEESTCVLLTYSECHINWDKGPVENTDDYGNDNVKNNTAPSQTTKHIIVAPSQGVLRFVPFAMKANVGDKIQFTWMANNHGVTKSSMTGICNATMDKPFKSPVQNSSATFETTVDTTDPMFYYCPVGNVGYSSPKELSNISNSTVHLVCTVLSIHQWLQPICQTLAMLWVNGRRCVLTSG